MKITLLVPQSGHSFVNQAQALTLGFKELGHETSVVRVEKEFQVSKLQMAEPDVIIAVGSWVHYRELIEGPKSAGFRVVPWLVSDDQVDRLHDELNHLPVLLTTSNHCRSIFLRDGVTTQIAVIPEAVDDTFWKPLGWEDVEPVAELLSVREKGISLPPRFDIVRLKKEGVPILFTTGGDATSKGALEVIHALGAIHASDPNMPWIYLLKTWPAAGSLQRSADELELAAGFGIADRIRYVVGEYSREFLRGLMNLCDIYVAPSRSEGFGLPLVEAQLCGKPAVGLAATASGETIVDGETGFIIRADTASDQPRADIGRLTEILSKLLLDTSLRTQLGKQTRLHARKTYAPTIIANKFLPYIT